MTGPSLAEVLPPPDPETVRRLLGLLGAAQPVTGDMTAPDSKTA